MADHQAGGGVYVYRGGRAPDHITHAIIDKAVRKIDDHAFEDNDSLLTVETHNGLEEIGKSAFSGCVSLDHLDIRSVRILQSYSFCSTGLLEVDADDLEIIEDNVFKGCESLRRISCTKVKKIGACAFEQTSLTELDADNLEIIEDNVFTDCVSLERISLPKVKSIGGGAFENTSLTELDGNNLEIIEDNVFTGCVSLERISLPKVKRIGGGAFENTSLTEVVLPKNIEFVGGDAFNNCRLRRICIPLKTDLFGEYPEHPYLYSEECEILSVELIGGTHETVSSLHMKVWRDDMNKEINKINNIIPCVTGMQTAVIGLWLQSVHSRFEHYKAEHIKVLKEATVLLELALWTAKLDDEECGGDDESLEVPTKKVKIDAAGRTRNEQRITSGADIVIKNVLPFLELK